MTNEVQEIEPEEVDNEEEPTAAEETSDDDEDVEQGSGRGVVGQWLDSGVKERHGYCTFLKPDTHLGGR